MSPAGTILVPVWVIVTIAGTLCVVAWLIAVLFARMLAAEAESEAMRTIDARNQRARRDLYEVECVLALHTHRGQCECPAAVSMDRAHRQVRSIRLALIARE